MFKRSVNPILIIFPILILIFTSSSCKKTELAKLEATDFSSDFDQGNIRNVTKVAENEFNMEIDPKEEHGADRPQWHYFQIKQNAKGQKVTLHIKGANPGFPSVYSYDQIHWIRIPDFKFEEGVLTVTQKFTEDTVWIARNFPYPYTLLQTHMDKWDDSPNVKRETLYTTTHFGGLKLELLTITDSSVPDANKKVIWIIGREHPSEVGGSWPLKGMIDQLARNSGGPGGPGGPSELIQQYIFKIVPMMNPDAVYAGKGYFSVNGVNFEENWNGKDGKPEDPEIAAVHKAINDWYASGKKIDLFITMHTAALFDDFIYCISVKESSQAYRKMQEPLFDLIINSTDFRYVMEFRTAPGDAVKELYDEHGTNGILMEFAKYKSLLDPTIEIWENQGRAILQAIHCYFSGRYTSGHIPIY